ncbi:hypothetical protein BGP_5607 [Beggiatoa sp. PS]|nr:hypothetical protein BGP_5607 [Beggiatoa sp. PS]
MPIKNKNRASISRWASNTNLWAPISQSFWEIPNRKPWGPISQNFLHLKRKSRKEIRLMNLTGLFD